MQGGYRILDHPADLGIEARGKTLAEAFEQAALGLMSVILCLETVKPNELRDISLKAVDREQLLVKWLTEVLYLYDGEKFVASKYTIEELTSDRLEAIVQGERFSESRHSTKLDVKAITYHQLEVREDEEGALVRVFLDI